VSVVQSWLIFFLDALEFGRATAGAEDGEAAQDDAQK
jgi:hypothetical protein